VTEVTFIDRTIRCELSLYIATIPTSCMMQLRTGIHDKNSPIVN